MKKYLIVLLVAIIIFSLAGYFKVVKEKQDLLNNINQIRNQIPALENERNDLIQDLEKQKQYQVNLNKEKELLQESLRMAEERISQISAELTEVENTIGQLKPNLLALRKDKQKLKQQTERLRNEKANLEARLHSLKELKMAAREIKESMRQAKIQMQEKIDEVITQEGNQGYLIRNGESTYKRVKIEVIPVTNK